MLDRHSDDVLRRGINSRTIDGCRDVVVKTSGMKLQLTVYHKLDDVR
jgi:hypothetical protein